MKNQQALELHETVLKIKEKKPLILCLTNTVTQDFVANSLLSLGAAPLMSNDAGELNDLLSLSSALYINGGTLNMDFITLTQIALYHARDLNIPVILDPVGAGASFLRTKYYKGIVQKACLVRGNASEIISLGKNSSTLESKGLESKGVEATHSVEDACLTARTLAQIHSLTVVVSGKQDFITNNTDEKNLNYGSDLMPFVTGVGCSLTAVLAAFKAVIPDSFKAAYLGMMYFTVCGKIAHKVSKGPASFKEAFLDTLYLNDLNSLRENL
ncbi:MAG TPA: hydroxyethylthiazole kinase [Alphaproteobacteria bacterium]|nr:hydroxyethylthiazole kinase [Alphaproteobacteria bacterium]